MSGKAPASERGLMFLQRSAGNRAVSGLVGSVQRASLKGGVDVKDGKIRETVGFSHKFETPEKAFPAYKCKVKGAAEISGKVTAEVVDPAGTPGQVSLTNKALEFGTEHTQKLWEADYKNEAGELEKVTVELKEGGSGDPFKEDEGGALTLEAEAKLAFKNGMSQTANLTILKLGASKTGTLPFDVTVGEIVLKHKMPVIKLDHEHQGIKFTGNLDVAYSGTAKLDSAALATDLMTRYGGHILARFGITPLNALRNLLASGPAMVGFFGGYITVKAALASLDDFHDMKRVRAAALDASAGYRSGFMTALGVPASAGEAAWFAHGMNQGNAALDAQVRKVQADPMFQAFAFTDTELRTAIKQACAANAEAIGESVYAAADAQIKASFVKQWREKLSWAQKTFTKTSTAEAQLRTMLGLPDRGELPTTDLSPGP